MGQYHPKIYAQALRTLRVALSGAFEGKPRRGEGINETRYLPVGIVMTRRSASGVAWRREAEDQNVGFYLGHCTFLQRKQVS